ncbi:MAG TPA: transporter substrate-binding domain-containing protein, partial [Azospirillaceae bacterium]|nr:transporter substrate-binding domain-containing protein [Azospirillaceae bacterium]
GVDFPTIYYYDGQGFLAHKSLAAHRLAEVTQASVCVDTGSTSAENLRDLAKSSKPGLKVVVFDSFEGALNGFFTRRCDLFSTDRLALVAIRAKRTPNASEYVIFPDVVSKEPLGPVVRDNDPQWSDVIKWVVAATIAAEELGLARDNIAEQRKAPRSPDVARFLGSESGNGKALGLAEDWAYQVVAQIGNYAEIHDRNVGEGSSLKLDRGLNALWNRGGLLYASPLH